MSAEYKRGDAMKTNFAGTPHREQVFKLLHPVTRLGNERGGQWWVQFCISGAKTVMLVTSCERVSPVWMERFRLE